MSGKPLLWIAALAALSACGGKKSGPDTPSQPPPVSSDRSEPGGGEAGQSAREGHHDEGDAPPPGGSSSPGEAPATAALAWQRNVTADFRRASRGMRGGVVLLPERVAPTVHAEAVCLALAATPDARLTCSAPKGTPAAKLTLETLGEPGERVLRVGAALSQGVNVVAEYALGDQVLTAELAALQASEWARLVAEMAPQVLSEALDERVKSAIGVPRPSTYKTRSGPAFVHQGIVWSVAIRRDGGLDVHVIRPDGRRSILLSGPLDGALPEHRVAFDPSAGVLRAALRGPIDDLEVDGELAIPPGPGTRQAVKSTLVLLEVRADGRILAHGINALTPASPPLAHPDGALVALARAGSLAAVLRLSIGSDEETGSLEKWVLGGAKVPDAALSWAGPDLLRLTPDGNVPATKLDLSKPKSKLQPAEKSTLVAGPTRSWRATSPSVALGDGLSAVCVDGNEMGEVFVHTAEGEVRLQVALPRGCIALEPQRDGTVVAAAGGDGGRYVVRLTD